MGLRKDRLADEIRDILALNLAAGQMSDPRLQSVAVTAVKLSGDLQVASVYFRDFKTEDWQASLAGLKSASGYLRKKLADALTVRRVPELRFYFDESIERAERVEKILAKL